MQCNVFNWLFSPADIFLSFRFTLLVSFPPSFWRPNDGRTRYSKSPSASPTTSPYSAIDAPQVTIRRRIPIDFSVVFQPRLHFRSRLRAADASMPFLFHRFSPQLTQFQQFFLRFARDTIAVAAFDVVVFVVQVVAIVVCSHLN